MMSGPKVSINSEAGRSWDEERGGNDIWFKGERGNVGQG